MDGSTTIGGITSSEYVPSSITNTQDLATDLPGKQNPIKRLQIWFQGTLQKQKYFYSLPHTLLSLLLCVWGFSFGIRTKNLCVKPQFFLQQ